MIVLAGDVGGTHTRLALIEVDAAGGSVRLGRRVDYGSRSSGGLVAAVRSFLGDGHAPHPDRACIAVAGPVVDGRAHLTNLDWRLDSDALTSSLGMPVRLLNDLEAVAHAVPHLAATDFVELQEGPPVPEAVVAVIAAGTGLGHAFLVPDGPGLRVLASEAGHADFAPRDGLETELAAHLRSRYGRVSWERVVSGPGLVDIRAFLARRYSSAGGAETPAAEGGEDLAAVITADALALRDPLSTQALEMFVSAYGAQAGNFVLSVWARGGVYLAGGIVPRILSKLTQGPFLRAFREKGRFTQTLARIPVRVITRPDVGVIGAALAGRVPSEPEDRAPGNRLLGSTGGA